MSEQEKQANQFRNWIDSLPRGSIIVLALVIALSIATIALFFARENNINICLFGGNCGSSVVGGSVFNEVLPIAAASVTVVVLTTVFGVSILPAVGVAAIAFIIVNLL